MLTGKDDEKSVIMCISAGQSLVKKGVLCSTDRWRASHKLYIFINI
jgi:hypothetical protein